MIPQRIQSYLRGMGIKPDTLEPKHAAWLIGDAAMSPRDLEKIGARGLPLREWGQLLPAMERFLQHRSRARRDVVPSQAKVVA